MSTSISKSPQNWSHNHGQPIHETTHPPKFEPRSYTWNSVWCWAFPHPGAIVDHATGLGTLPAALNGADGRRPPQIHRTSQDQAKLSFEIPPAPSRSQQLQSPPLRVPRLHTIPFSACTLQLRDGKRLWLRTFSDTPFI